MSRKKGLFILVITACLGVIQGCGSLENVSGDRENIYDREFNFMVETVERAIRAQSLVINFSRKSDDGNRYLIIFHSPSFVNANSDIQRKDEGEVIIERVDNNKTKVVISNPEYHYSIPSHHRRKYDKELKEGIDRLLKS